MAKAKKLPSGSWRCLVYDYTDANGKRKYKSFTESDPSAAGRRKCEMRAAEYAASKNTKRSGTSPVTLGQAWDDYIELRSNVLSPATIREYKSSRKNSFLLLMDKNIYDITQDDVQNEINKISKKAAPKTVRNKHGMISAVLKQYRPDFALSTKLPQKVKPDLYIPTDADVKKLISSIKNDDDLLTAVLLAAFGPMRRSEICGLESSDISNGIAHVQRAVVLNDNREWVTKGTKSIAGDRYIPLPDFIISRISSKKGRVVNLHPNNITDRFEKVLKRNGLPHFRFHDLRHYSASILHAMGIPDAYIMQRGGWGSDAVLKNVYRHALEDKETEMNNKANEHFSQLFDL
nr:MAG TPA: Integrase [Caudoviricetes sp.]